MEAGVLAPVLVDLQAHGAGPHLFQQRAVRARTALAEQAHVHRKGVQRLQHGGHMPGARGAGGGQRSGGRPGAAAYHGGRAGGQASSICCVTDEMDMRIDGAGRHDQPSPATTSVEAPMMMVTPGWVSGCPPCRCR